jgi:hypothetical protein
METTNPEHIEFDDESYDDNNNQYEKKKVKETCPVKAPKNCLDPIWKDYWIFGAADDSDTPCVPRNKPCSQSLTNYNNLNPDDKAEPCELPNNVGDECQNPFSDDDNSKANRMLDYISKMKSANAQFGKNITRSQTVDLRELEATLKTLTKKGGRSAKRITGRKSRGRQGTRRVSRKL